MSTCGKLRLYAVWERTRHSLKFPSGQGQLGSAVVSEGVWLQQLVKFVTCYHARHH